jgi:hypothetical protein
MMDGREVPKDRRDGAPGTATTLSRLRTDDPLTRIQELERQVETLQMTCGAIWELLGPRAGFGPEDLGRRIDEIDLRDGRLDGRLAPPAVECGGCGKRIGGHRTTCYYCGTVLTHAGR